ncbi:MFS transporter [Spirillospora sp. NPDC048911]|uniref:MFS transporter n=1 Tax=Spirillospora sp. NPDC048911 TaxID=3364527 RepID=UPI003714EBD7
MSHQRAITLVFAVHGAVAGSFATRIPWIQDQLSLSPALLGGALLCPSIGAIVGMPMAGRLAHRLGERPAIQVLLAMWCAQLVLPALAPAPVWLFGAMVLFGVAAGMSDVVMNAHAVRLERHLGRSIMTGLHGMWCVGSLAGGGAGMVAAHLHIDARAHFAAVAVVLLGVGLVNGRSLFAGQAAAAEPAPRRFVLPSKAIAAIGVVGFCGTFAEGATADWAAVYLTRVTDAGPGVAAAGYTIFMLAMASARLVADRFVRRFGPVAVVRCGGTVAAAGGVLVVIARTPAAGIAGFALLGLGVAAIVPLVFTAAGNAARTPAEGVAGVATITYLSVLTAPAVTGWAADAASYPVAFALITGVIVVMTLLAGVLTVRGEPPAPTSAGQEKPVPPEKQPDPASA